MNKSYFIYRAISDWLAYRLGMQANYFTGIDALLQKNDIFVWEVTPRVIFYKNLKIWQHCTFNSFKIHFATDLWDTKKQWITQWDAVLCQLSANGLFNLVTM